jgi:hypothetical protein
MLVSASPSFARIILAVLALRGVGLIPVQARSPRFELREAAPVGWLLKPWQLAEPPVGRTIFDLPQLANTTSLCLIFRGKGNNVIR